MSQQQNNDMQQHYYRASADDFDKVPGAPIAYWVSSAARKIFYKFNKISTISTSAVGQNTGDNERFLKYWYEISWSKIGIGCESREETFSNDKKWYPYNKGGGYRKWYGNFEYVVNWHNDAQEIKKYAVIRNGGKHWSRYIQNLEWLFHEGITWSDVTSGRLAGRYLPTGFISDVSGHCAFFDGVSPLVGLSILNSKFVFEMSRVLNPTIHFQAGNYRDIPYADKINSAFTIKTVQSLVDIGEIDWVSFEGHYGCVNQPLLTSEIRQSTLDTSYQKLRTKWRETTLEMQRLEEENNRIFIDAYGLQGELTPEVPLSEITLTCNPHYRYGGNLTDEEREARLQSDTICELISYVIGCMMGRYSLDREGLVYAHAGNEGFKALVEEGAYATFAADEDGILPLSADSWFEDDVATRLEAFACSVWGKETLEENLQFIADSLCLAAIKPVKKGGETSRETLRRYLSTQFYKDHLKTYKKRPIYWLFSSGKEKAFECLVYLHRYNEATLPRMRTEYVTPLLGQMAGRIERLRLQQTEASTSDAKRIGKEIDSLTKQLAELRAFDDQLKHYADMRITLDLDDGVKVNYGKFGTLLSDVKAITGDKGE